MKRAAERWMGALVALSAFLFYLARPSGFYNFDGVACAIAVELGDFAHLTHGNHLAYGVLGWAFHRLLLLLGFGGTALLSLQLLDTLLGAAGVGLFYGWLKEQKIPGPAALAASACLATSYAYWFWSLEAQVYMLGAVFLLLAARELFSERPRPLLLGLLHAGAVLGHVGHVMFVPAALYLLRRGPGHKKAIRDYLAALAGAVLAAYAFAGAAMVAPRSGRELTIW
ncbi:MAG TPA: hypothetical protein VNI01_14580, partial [Elusimicrobiota bacterium]|nr:hypothetical protein [Elusimicrobiota bacterium]